MDYTSISLILILISLILVLLVSFCVKQHKTIENFRYTLGDLNSWANDVSPKTPLNTWCKNAYAKGDDLKIGQHCVANCVGVNSNINSQSSWFSGPRIRQTASNLVWENASNNTTNEWNPQLSKINYCDNVQII